MARRRANTTKLEIIQVATQMFMERGFTETSAKAVSDKLDISTGNLTFHFPTKEQKWYSEPTYPIGKRKTFWRRKTSYRVSSTPL